MAPGFEGKALGYEGISEGVTGEELPIDPDRKAREDGCDYPELRAWSLLAAALATGPEYFDDRFGGPPSSGLPGEVKV